MRRMLSVVVVGSATLGLFGCEVGMASHGLAIGVGRQADERFEWEGRVAAGQQVEIKGINGALKASRSASGLVEVTADRRGWWSDPNDVRVEVVEHPGGVTLCAVYPREGNTCLPGDDGRLSAKSNDVKVTFRVMVPDAVDFTARTVNGSVTAADLTGDVEVRTVNGSIDVATDGDIAAKTVNGSITASMGETDWSGERQIETVNGSVRVWLPERADADLHVRTRNGAITSDLAMSAVESGRRRLEARLGDGGRALRVTTVNGSVRIRPIE